MFNDLLAFIRRQYPGQETIPLHAPVLGEFEKQHLAECIDSTFVSSVGPSVDQFEQLLCKFVGCRYAVATVNGTAALQLGLHAIGVGQEMEVILQPMTFIASANAISHCGAVPVFVDIECESLGICPDALQDWLETHTEVHADQCINKTTGRVVKACMCMHSFGLPSKLEELYRVCEAFHITLVADGAEALGSEYRGGSIAQHAAWTTFSFNGNKIITTGGGGALVTNDEGLAVQARHLATTAKISHAWESRHDAIGFNFRMPNINAALGCAQLRRLPSLLADKRALAAEYGAFLSESTLQWLVEPEHGRSNYWLNAALCADAIEREQLLLAAKAQNIQLRPVWELLSDSQVYAHAQAGPLPVAGEIAQRLVNLPSSPRSCIHD